MTQTLLIRYGELTLKSPPVRRSFETQLRRNLLEQFAREGIIGRLRSDRGHLYAEVNDGPQAIGVIRRVFGITSVSAVVETPADPEAIAQAAIQIAEPKIGPGTSIAVRARRTGSHSFTSQELARTVGGRFLSAFADRAIRVDLDRPDFELFVEVRDARAYLSVGRTPGPGGLPLGVAGSVAAYVDGPRAAVGAFLMMKRGCRTAFVVSEEGAPLVDQVLGRFELDPPTERCSTGDWTDRLAEVATRYRADAVVLPLSVEEYPAARERWGDRVVFSPTVGWTDEEVMDRWESIVALLA